MSRLVPAWHEALGRFAIGLLAGAAIAAGLTPEQAEALRNQVDIYDYEIQPRR